jgi:D-alanyl-D-alanine carboxypeptidase
VNSGYRSAEYRQRVYDCWVKELGSPEEARECALPPQESAHVLGYAMDVAPQGTATWLAKSGGAYGFCRRYANEPWHFEFQKSYRTKGCPQLLAYP